MQEFYMRQVKLPPHVEATVLPNDDGTFDIYVNSELPEEKQREAFDHEVRHIKLDHLYNYDPVVINELEADEQITVSPIQNVNSVDLKQKLTTARPQNSKRKKKMPTPQYPTSPDELWEHNQKMLLRWEEKWLYDVG
ncbi:hypothetical protein [Anaerotruncus rubiinfantis]|uniref:hypothetical protein n=1 Tax=Anaerotruncus rubiinfantis TaxID=1720200 RepID=UPI00189C0F5F|nr:hypothetical protein [Anaerotruncus rubiinfantis]